MRTRHDLGDGHQLEIEVYGEPGGPVLAVLGGVHGDELEGIVAARGLALELAAAETARTLRGQVRIVSVSNPVAFAARARVSPLDDANLARVFPGRADGSITERIAHLITTEVIAGADLLVDLHSAGAHYTMPIFAGYVTTERTAEQSAEAAYAFGAPLVWEHVGSGPGRSLSAAAELGVPSIYVEGSGGGGLIGAELDVYSDGLRRLVGLLAIAPGPSDAPVAPRVLRGGDGNVDTSLSCANDGFCVTRVEVGAEVTTGTCLAEIVGDDGQLIEQIVAPRPASVMMLRRRAEVHAGDGIAMLGPVPATGRE